LSRGGWRVIKIKRKKSKKRQAVRPFDDGTQFETIHLAHRRQPSADPSSNPPFPILSKCMTDALFMPSPAAIYLVYRLDVVPGGIKSLVTIRSPRRTKGNREYCHRAGRWLMAIVSERFFASGKIWFVVADK
jgi:hypothetical protein